MLKEIEKYNESVPEEKEIHEMCDLKNELINFGYEENELDQIYLLNEIKAEYFDEDDEYFWWSDNGYLYSGNKNDVLALIGNNEKTNESNVLYRYVITIDGNEYGFIRGIDKLIEKEKLNEYSKEIQRINALLSRMKVPEIDMLNEEKKCYFTEKGKSFYKRIIQQITNILNELGYKVKEITKITNNFTKIDEYQVLAKHLKNKNGVKTMHLIKKANNNELRNFINLLKLQKSSFEEIIRKIIIVSAGIDSIDDKNKITDLINNLNELSISLKHKQENANDAIEGIIKILEEKRNQM